MIDDENRLISLPKKVYNKIESNVVDLLIKLNISTLPIDPFSIAEKLGIEVIPYSEISFDTAKLLMEKGCDAINYYDKEKSKFVILYDNISYIYERQKFTIAHEIGHIRLGHKEESDLAKKMADYYAAYLLAPSPLMWRTGCETYIDVQDLFRISQESSYYSFTRYANWTRFSGYKNYERDLLIQFKYKHLLKRR